MEKWKRIEGLPDYEISSHGRVMSYKRGSGFLLKQTLSKRGYVRISFRHNDIQKKIHIHQLVIKHFGPPQPPNTTCDHLNRIKTDNRIENLRWATKEEQTENSVHAKQIGETNGCSKLTESQVIEIKLRMKEKVNYSSLAREYNVSPTTIFYIRTGKLWSHLN